MTDWIKRSDRMPGGGDPVLAYYAGSGMRRVDFWPYDEDWTHWMPLPDPPKRTVMVELEEEDAREWAQYAGCGINHGPSRRLYESCRKALKEMDR